MATLFSIQDPKRKLSFTDDVADVCAAAVDDPVVPVEGQLVAHQRAEPGPRRELSGLAAKVLERRVAAFLKKSHAKTIRQSWGHYRAYSSE